jgi:hypothetical protein
MNTAHAERLSFRDSVWAGIDPPDLARQKVDRLRELRAVISTLRCEREARDLLQGNETRPHD